MIACKVMARELYYSAFQSPAFVDIQLLEQQLHNVPDNLRQTLQEAIDSVEESNEKYDAIILGYGLCSNGIMGIKSRKTPLVIPRMHDCISLFLGSKDTYRSLFDSASGGVYWYTPGWLETCLMPGPDRNEALFKHYSELYDEDNAEFLIESENSWIREYKNAYYVNWPQLHNEDYIDYTKYCADKLGWNFRLIEGSDSLLTNLLKGNWEDERFLIVPAGLEVVPSYDENTIIKAQ